MRLVRRLLGIGLLAASVFYLRQRRRLLRSNASDPVKLDDSIGTSVAASDAGAMHEVATRSGIADVDPVPLSHVAGEGIDPVRDVDAHTTVVEQRERMPRH